MEQNLNYYKIFYEVAKTGNISKAGENLYISQPAVSKSITKLEQALGHMLFFRNKKGVRLTDEGQTLFEHLDKAFASISLAEQELQRIKDFGMGQIRIGVSTSLCKHILLPYLQEYIRENPHVKVTIACNPTFETIQLLKEGKIDIGLICDTPLDKGYHFLPVRSIHDTFVTTQTYLDNLTLREHNKDNDASMFSATFDEEKKDDDLATIPNMTGLFYFTDITLGKKLQPTHLSTKEIIEKSNLMLLDRDNISRQFIDQYFKMHDIHPAQMLEINNMDLLIDFASIGMGVACVVREFISSYLDSNQVIEIPLEYNIPERTVGFVYNEHLLNTGTRKFINFYHALSNSPFLS